MRKVIIVEKLVLSVNDYDILKSYEALTCLRKNIIIPFDVYECP